MKPVMQTRYGFDGNCFAACLASVLELPLAALPEVHPADTDWWSTMQSWLATRGLTLLAWPNGEHNAPPRGWGLAGTSPPELADVRNELGQRLGHTVVTFDGRVVHDPHPFDDSGPIKEWYAFAVLDPSRVGL